MNYQFSNPHPLAFGMDALDYSRWRAKKELEETNDRLTKATEAATEIATEIQQLREQQSRITQQLAGLDATAELIRSQLSKMPERDG